MVEALYQADEAVFQRKARAEDLVYRYIEKRYCKNCMLLSNCPFSESDRCNVYPMERSCRAEKLGDCRRLVDKRVMQLQTVSQLAALLAGFEMVVLVETYVDTYSLYPALLATWATSCALAIAMTLTSTLICSFLLVIILEYDEKQSVVDNTHGFGDFWVRRCERDWEFAFSCFTWGITTFLVSLGLLGFVRFYPSLPASILVAVVSFMSLVYFSVYISSTYGSIGSSACPSM